jgi:hypothetical protein
MKTTHTPGPWAIGIETDNERAQVIDADGGHICYVENDPVMGNAYLIAAAPDLLDIHRQHVSLLSGYSRWIGKTARERELIAAIKIAVEKSQDVIADAVEGTNAGCDKCGMADRVPGSVYCEECKKEEDGGGE